MRDLGDLAARLAIGDPHAIVERELGLTAIFFEGADFDRIVRAHMEWTWDPPYASTPAVTQGLVAGVPCTIWCGVASPLEGTEPHCWIVCATAYAHELEDRLR
jgi:hypothetical protein